MKLFHLKKIRVIVSLIFFALLAFLFLDFSNLVSPAYTNYLTYLQFVPSFIKVITVFDLASAGFIIILILTLLFGRFYCSSICPLGTLQDIFAYLGKKIHKKKYYHLLKPNNFLRYSFLILASIFLLWGSLFIINLLDPYSNFGRIFTQLIKPIIIGINNLVAFTLSRFDIYSVYPIEIKSIDLILALFPFSFLVLIFWLSFYHGRLFCNTVCPVGSILGLLSKFSLFKIKIDEQNCISCNLCERVCKSGCIDKKNKVVDYTRCVDCFNCLTVCPSEGITFNKYKLNKKVENDSNINYSKREFILKSVAFIFFSSGLSFAQKKIIPKKLSTIPILKKFPVSPPGSKSIQHFTNSCTACNLCVSACPTQVLQPSFLEYGFLGMLQPTMNFKIGFCNFDCVICSQVCPSGAILPVILEKKKTIQLGKVNFIKENCIVVTEKTDCGACAEHCPTKAVTMVPYENIKIPEIKNEYCIGCGACENACPTKPYKSIYIEGNPIHLTAKKKEDIKSNEKIDYKEEFPF
jgi:ferredoxin